MSTKRRQFVKDKAYVTTAAAAAEQTEAADHSFIILGGGGRAKSIIIIFCPLQRKEKREAPPEKFKKIGKFQRFIIAVSISAKFLSFFGRGNKHQLFIV